MNQRQEYLTVVENIDMVSGNKISQYFSELIFSYTLSGTLNFLIDLLLIYLCY